MSATLARVHAYWRQPWDGRNAPEMYTASTADERSEFLVDLFARHIPQESSVLEVGCNAGRNLAHLRRAGYASLAGIDISPAAVLQLRTTFPELDDAAVTVGPAEDILAAMVSGAVDTVFTMAVLEHIHPDVESMFADMARVAGRTIVTVEDERPSSSWRHWTRNYRCVFEGLGWTQTESVHCRSVGGLGPRFMARVFVR